MAQSIDSLPPVANASAATTPVDASRAIAETDRTVVGLGAGDDETGGELAWDYTRFDFDGIVGVSHAEVHRVTLRGHTGWRGWTFDASAVHTDADYGATPDDLHIDWPASNPWLSLWDAFDVTEMAALGRDVFTVLALDGRAAVDRFAGGGRTRLAVRDGLGRPLHASARAWIDAAVTGPWYAAGDARVAWYDDAVGGGGTFWTGWTEVGYRSDILKANLGFGFDPIVFDAIVGDYADIGHTAFLRGALDGGFARSRGGEITQRLVDRERSLSDAAVFKVEFILRLP
jgi:hypothetical protein